jgi:uncharacterized protein (TIGR03083 family)
MSHDGGMSEPLSSGADSPRSVPSDVRPRLTPADFLTRIDASATAFAELLTDADLDAPVSACPGWSLAGLADHLGTIHQWATHAIVAGNPDAEPSRSPSGAVELADWYRESAELLTSTLRTTDPDTPVWTFGPKPRTASFWFRRQAHEISIHLWDAIASQGDAAPIEPALAMDGIDEVVTMFFPRQVRLGRISPLDQVLALHAVGPEGSGHWLLAGDGSVPNRRTMTGIAPSSTSSGPLAVDGSPLGAGGDASSSAITLGPGSGPGAGSGVLGVGGNPLDAGNTGAGWTGSDVQPGATLTGSPEALLLLLWGRTGLDDNRLTVSGDRAAAQAVLATALTP